MTHIVSRANTDWDLVEQVRTGNDGAFDALMNHYKRPVLNFVYRMIGDAAEAQDVAQDVFVRAYRSMRKPLFRPAGAQFSTWLFQVARNAAIDCLRRRKRHPESLCNLEDNGDALPAADAGAASEIETRELGRQIAAAVALLPEDQRTAFILAEYEDFPCSQIAAVMGCSVKSVEARLYRARLFLRARLAHLLA